MNKPHMSECIAARLVLVLFICLCLLVPTLTIIGRASAEEAGTPTDTSQEVQIAPEYAVKFSHTADWSRQTQELLKITKSIAKGKGYTIDEGCDSALLAYFNAVQALRPATAGNGRLARNKVEEAILNQSRRLAVEPQEDLSLLISTDFDLEDVSGE